MEGIVERQAQEEALSAAQELKNRKYESIQDRAAHEAMIRQLEGNSNQDQRMDQRLGQRMDQRLGQSGVHRGEYEAGMGGRYEEHAESLEPLEPMSWEEQREVEWYELQAKWADPTAEDPVRSEIGTGDCVAR